MSKSLARRAQLTERIIFKLSPSQKARLYDRAAADGKAVSDLERSAIESVIRVA